MYEKQAVSIASAFDEKELSALVVGESAAMRDVMTIVRQIAKYPATVVLLQGESGTGKDVIARALHYLSARPPHKFVAINCAALPDMLLETELFGVEAGAFTDAKVSRDGYILRADGGTLFLDEIGSMPRSLQAKLLRFLETRSFCRIGSTRTIHVDLRVVSATNVDLHTAVREGLFREDLYYRLKVVTITLPPLRERPEDIGPLVEFFLHHYGAEIENVEPLRISAEAMELLYQYHWPGNVRELRNVIQRGQILCEDHEIRPRDLPEQLCNVATSMRQQLWEMPRLLHLPEDGLDLPAFLQRIEKKFIMEALERCAGNQVHAAQLLGVTRDQLRYRLLKMRAES